MKPIDDFYAIELYSEDQICLQLNTNKILASFLNLLLEKAKGIPIATILEHVRIPSKEDLSDIVSDHSQNIESFDELDLIINKKIKEIFKYQMAKALN